MVCPWKIKSFITGALLHGWRTNRMASAQHCEVLIWTFYFQGVPDTESQKAETTVEEPTQQHHQVFTGLNQSTLDVLLA